MPSPLEGLEGVFAEDVQLAKNTGMNEHIAKPLDLNKLNDVLKQWL